MMIENLKEKMRNGVAEFLFLKKNGTVRHAFGTTKGSLANKHINGNGASRENFATTAYFDVEAGAWRSFRWESIVKVY